MLLERARGLMGRLPFDQIDVLVVGELGKNYSGAGMDPNVIGRLLVETQPDFDRPVVTRLVVLDVSDESHGNIVGVGFADLTTERLVSKMDPRTVPDQHADLMLPRAGADPDHSADRPRRHRGRARHLLADRPGAGAGGRDPQHARAQDALGLAPLEDEVRAHPHLALETDYLPMPFGQDGSLDQAACFPKASGRTERGEQGVGPSWPA